MAEKIYRGRTEDAEAPFLGLEFWTVGKKISGVVVRQFVTKLEGALSGPCSVVQLVDPVEVGGESCDEISVGNLAGFVMAMQAAKLDRLHVGDKLVLTCTGLKAPKKEGYSPRVNFEIEVTTDPIKRSVPAEPEFM